MHSHRSVRYLGTIVSSLSSHVFSIHPVNFGKAVQWLCDALDYWVDIYGVAQISSVVIAQPYEK